MSAAGPHQQHNRVYCLGMHKQLKSAAPSVMTVTNLSVQPLIRQQPPSSNNTAEAQRCTAEAQRCTHADTVAVSTHQKPVSLYIQ
jgi:hypothetical protein